MAQVKDAVSVANKVFRTYENRRPERIAKEMGISIERVRQYKAKGLRCLRCSPFLKQLYRENMRHEQLRRLQWYQTRPDKHLYIEELEERYAKTLRQNVSLHICPVRSRTRSSLM